MILLDTNLLVYAHVDSFAEHDAARRWLDGRLNGPEQIGFPWASLIAFLRLVTNPRVFPRPESIAEAWHQVEEWLANDNAWIPQPTERHVEVIARQLSLPGIYGGLVHDAHLAALAIEHGLELCTTDGDFARFPGLRWKNPLR